MSIIPPSLRVTIDNAGNLAEEIKRHFETGNDEIPDQQFMQHLEYRRKENYWYETLDYDAYEILLSNFDFSNPRKMSQAAIYVKEHFRAMIILENMRRRFLVDLDIETEINRIRKGIRNIHANLLKEKPWVFSRERKNIAI